MNRIVKQFIKQFEVSSKKGWDKIYVGVDLHETVLKPSWTATLDKEFYNDAKETLLLMSKSKNICLILWSCSLKELNQKYSEYFRENGIIFDYINENPEVTSTEYADFDTKLYFNVGLDDKFGFDIDEDWPALLEYFSDLEKNKIAKK